MATFQDLIDRGRLSLNDDDKTRYFDPENLTYANMALAIIRRKRPDLFFGTYNTPLVPALLTDVFPLAMEYEVCMVDYLIARSQAKDTEFGENSRVEAFFGMAAAFWTGVRGFPASRAAD